MIAIIPNYVRDAVYTKLCESLISAGITRVFKEHLDDIYGQILNYLDEHGELPDFKITAKEG